MHMEEYAQQQEAAIQSANEAHEEMIKLLEEENEFRGCKAFLNINHCSYKHYVVPPQEGGIDYKKQYELLQIANLVLSDQITLLQYHTKMIKDSLDVILLKL